MVDRAVAGQLSEKQGQALVCLARETIRAKLNIPLTSTPEDLPVAYWQDSVFQEQRGVFVTLHRAGQLRGCIGSLVGVSSIVEGVRSNALNSAFNDCRFTPVTPEEFTDIDLEVSILSEPRRLSYDGADDLLDKLRPDIDGVIIKKSGSSATFLPQVWQQLPGVEEFLSHLCQKAGLSAGEWRRGELDVMTYQVQCFVQENDASSG